MEICVRYVGCVRVWVMDGWVVCALWEVGTDWCQQWGLTGANSGD